MDNKKIFTIQINGIQESVTAVEALNKQLNDLEKRIKALESSNVNVNATSKSGGGNASALSEEEAIQREINKLKAEGLKLDAKIVAAQDEVYKKVDATKQLYKETVADQKALAAQERLTANAYSNTMQGMKQHLADLKAVINTTDLGDSDKIKQMTQDANELTTKLKEMEAAYGQFGRNVGNYQDAANGFNKLKFDIAGVTQEFDNAKQALKTLQGELRTLQVKKDNGIILTEEEAKRFKELPDIVAKLKSSIADAGKPMDALLDSMQSFVSIAQVGKGFSAFFGIDNDEIERSIQKLVALQNAMQGLQNIQKQMQSQEGIGKVFSEGSKSIDEFVAKITKAKIGVDGLEKSTKLGTTAVRLFSGALKGLASLGIMAAVTALIDLLGRGIDYLKDWTKGDADLVSAEDALTAAIENQNKVLDKNLDLIQKKYDAGEISKEQARIETENAYAKAIAETNKRLLEREAIYNKVGIQQEGKSDLYLSNAIGDTGVTSFGGFKEGIKGIEDFNKRWDLLSAAVANGTAALKKWNYTADDTKDDFAHMSKLAGGDLLNAFNKLADGTREGTKALVEYINKMDELTSGRYSQAIKIGIDKGYLDEQFKYAWSQYENLKNNVYRDPVLVRLEVEADAKNFLKSLDPNGALKERMDNWKKQLEENVKAGGTLLSIETVAQYEKAIKEGEKKISESESKINSSITKAYNSRKKLVTEAERELANLRISNMKDGLNKTLTQLEENRKQEIAKITANGVNVAELTKEINIKYDNEILKAKKEWADNVVSVYSDMWDNIYSLTMSNARMNADAESTILGNTFEKAQNKYSKSLDRKYSDYSIDTNNISKQAQKTAGIIPDLDKRFDDTPKLKKQVKEYIALLEDIELNEKIYKKSLAADDEIYANQFKKFTEEKKKALQEWLKEQNVTEEELKASFEYEALMHRNYTTSLAKQYSIRLYDRKAYYLNVEKAAKEHADGILNNEKELLNKETEYENKRAESAFIARQKEYDAQELKEYNGIVSDELRKRLGIEGTYEEDRLAIQKKYEELRKKDEEEYKKQLDLINKTQKAEEERLEQEHQNAIKDIVSNSHYQRIQEYRDFISRLQKIQSSTPITDSFGWGVVRTSETRKQYRDALEGYKNLASDIIEEKNKLQESLDKNEISFDDFQQAQRELNVLHESVTEAINGISNNLKRVAPGIDNTFGQLMQSINTYVQAGLQSIQTILSAVWNAQDAEFDKEQEEIDKYNEKLQKALDEQEEIIEEHSNKVESIEDELATARGDRRQHLIDQLNAESEAQRQALKEKQKIEKQEEALKKRQEKLDKERKMAEYKRNLLSIIVSNAMAAANGYATKPFIPVGLAMGSLAIALGAAQYAIAASAKPYAKGGQLDGGVAQGKRHSEGGIPVLGGRASIEGGEFITNRQTTAKNVDLLEYINAKHRKLNIDDFIDFYSSGNAKKNFLASSPRQKFADGGVIPTLNNEYQFDDRLLSAFEDYSNRPVYVSVVDINSRQAAVKNVQVLAGISEE